MPIAQAQPDPDAVTRGKALTEAADCGGLPYRRSGHTPFAGRQTHRYPPFGGIYSPNLTPDRDTGIGGWSDDDFSTRPA